MPADAAKVRSSSTCGHHGAGRAEWRLLVLDVGRATQLQAIDSHVSQSRTNPVMRRRLELQQQTAWLRLLRDRSAVRT